MKASRPRQGHRCRVQAKSSSCKLRWGISQSKDNDMWHQSEQERTEKGIEAGGAHASGGRSEKRVTRYQLLEKPSLCRICLQPRQDPIFSREHSKKTLDFLAVHWLRHRRECNWGSRKVKVKAGLEKFVRVPVF